MASITDDKILIVGAGIGGLVLAQVLRANGIPFEIFERDAVWTARNQGYSVGLHEALPPLEELLPKDIGEISSVSVNYGFEESDTIGIYDIEARKRVMLLGGHPRGHQAYVLRANRPKTRDFLWQKLDIQVGKKFTHYTEDRDSITAHFDDGTSATGSLLVGADGSRSKIRAQMIGDDGPQLQYSQWQVINGELELPKLQYRELCEIANSAIAAVYRDTMRFVWAVREPKADGSCKCFWGLAWHTDDPAADVAWLGAANKNSKYRKVLSLAKPLPPFLHEVIEMTGPAGIGDDPLTLAEFVPPRALPRGRATLLGDALHTMIPFRGAGANTASLDACDLAKILIKGWKSGERLEWMLKNYEDIALPRGREAVLSSREAGQGPDTMKRLIARDRSVQFDEEVKEVTGLTGSKDTSVVSDVDSDVQVA